jgi:glycosyltransferase involved in cell wall biosynthesis
VTAAITVIVPGFDVAPYAAEALASLQAQTRDDWVAVLIDDGSSDATAHLFEDAAAADPRFRVIRHSTRRGLSAARNTGLDVVDTPFVGFLDADDRYRPDALAVLLGALEDSGSDFAVGAYVRLRADPTGQYTAGVVQPWVAAATDPARRGTTIDAHPAASGNIVAWSKVSRTDFWRRAGLRFPEGRLYEDQILAQQMYSRARRFDTVPDVVVEWRERADGTSITQGKHTLPVLREYLEAMLGGIRVLDTAEHRAAAQARVDLILGMDLPPLVEIARTHPDDGYRRALGGFARTLSARAEHPGASPAVSAALLW